jgi:hypothetical protein
MEQRSDRDRDGGAAAQGAEAAARDLRTGGGLVGIGGMLLSVRAPVAHMVLDGLLAFLSQWAEWAL